MCGRRRFPQNDFLIIITVYSARRTEALSFKEGFHISRLVAKYICFFKSIAASCSTLLQSEPPSGNPSPVVLIVIDLLASILSIVNERPLIIAS